VLFPQAEQNLGMSMVFTLASRAKEWLDEIFVSVAKHAQYEDERLRLEAEEVCSHHLVWHLGKNTDFFLPFPSSTSSLFDISRGSTKSLWERW